MTCIDIYIYLYVYKCAYLILDVLYSRVEKRIKINASLIANNENESFC